MWFIDNVLIYTDKAVTYILFQSGTHGQDCEKQCVCIPENTESCHHVDGKCNCKPGYTGIFLNLNLFLFPNKFKKNHSINKCKFLV